MGGGEGGGGSLYRDLTAQINKPDYFKSKKIIKFEIFERTLFLNFISNIYTSSFVIKFYAVI